MKKYILKRILTMIPIFIITSMIVFSIIHLTPGDPARVILGVRAVESDVIALQERMGLNKPIPLQYIEWVTGIFKVVTSIERRDYMVIQAFVLVIALINMFMMLILDILYAAIDPRIRLDSR